MEKIDFDDVFAVKNDGDDVLGKLIYFNLSNPLIERDKLIAICADLKLPVNVGQRFSTIDAFRTATSDVRDRIITPINGELCVRKIYFRDNDKAENIISRELICETLGQTTNGYKKLANIYYRKDTDTFDYTIEDPDPILKAAVYCDKAQERFELYKICVGRNQLENLIDGYVERMECLKMNTHGKLYFILKKNIHMVDVFEDFIETLNANNKNSGKLNVNSLFVADNTKQRGKIADEFCHYARQKIQNYTERIERYIASNGANLALLERWANKADSLQDKKREYEELLHRELNELDDDYQTLCLLSDELKLRASKLRQSQTT